MSAERTHIQTDTQTNRHTKRRLLLDAQSSKFLIPCLFSRRHPLFPSNKAHHASQHSCPQTSFLQMVSRSKKSAVRQDVLLAALCRSLSSKKDSHPKSTKKEKKMKNKKSSSQQSICNTPSGVLHTHHSMSWILLWAALSQNLESF